MLQTASFFRWPTGTQAGCDVEQLGGKRLDVAFRYPRRAEIGVDVAGQHVLGLHFPQGLDIAGKGRAGALGGGELGPHVAGEIGVGGLPGLGFRVGEDQVAQFGDDLCSSACRRGSPINGRSTAPRWLRETSNPSSALADRA